ncbi:MAG: signal peptidase [Gemmatimonadetes bacterium]|jgi:signal peptidase I|nr:signal peptidase [Gemmatimonadota bacterium]
MPPNVVSNARGKRGSPKQRAGGGASPLRGLWELLKSIAGALLIYLVVNTLLIAAYRIPSGSMIPTLLVGDWLFVNKLVYGPHIPFTTTSLPGYADPKRGEVIVFESPYQADNAPDYTPTLVKRMVGMPGDTLYMRKGLLYVNGIAQRQGFGVPNPAAMAGADAPDPAFDWQHKFELTQSRFGRPPAQPSHDNWGPLRIPTNHYMMLGDNRYESKDSRYWGLVPRENVRGRPIFVYYSYRADDSDRPLPFLTDIRWGRIGTRIH